jgi:hypothetical protein
VGGGVHHLAGTAHLADDLPTGARDKTVAYYSRSSVSVFFQLRKRAPQFTGHGNPDNNLESHCTLRRSVECENDRWIMN